MLKICWRGVRVAGVSAVLAVMVLTAANHSRPAAAISVGPQPPATTTSPDIIITSMIGNSTLEDLEIYNQSDVPIDLAGWSFTFTLKDSGACSSGETTGPIDFPAGWILPKDYLTFENNGTDSTAAIFNVNPGFGSGCVNPWLSSIKILNGGQAEQTVVIPGSSSIGSGVKQKQRDNSPSSSRTLTGTFNTDYVALSSSDTTLYSDPLYVPPADTDGLQIVEVLPNSEDCSPLDTSLNCGDFVKLYNSSTSTIDLSNYRLRTNYDGNKSTASNTVQLNGSLDAGKYTVVNTKNDGTPLSLTDTGGYVWLEDAYGAVDYQPIIQYPSASSTTKVGWAWALNGDAWQWSSAPTADANVFPPEVQEASVATSASFKPCNANQYRNPATNRCDLIASSSSTLVPCSLGQERNPATNRCRSVLGASTSLKPCAIGQERNPATNRCRKTVAGVASVKDVKSATAAGRHDWQWIIALIVAAGALAYAAYEWRQEIVSFLEKVKAKTEKLRFKK